MIPFLCGLFKGWFNPITIKAAPVVGNATRGVLHQGADVYIGCAGEAELRDNNEE